MTGLPILRWPDPRLSTPCDPVAAGEDLDGLIRAMFDTMYAAPGRGLAAPQVGVLKRLFVMDCGWKDGEMTPMVCINPEITQADGMAPGAEGCLSIPGVLAEVLRPERITLRYLDQNGCAQEAELDGFEARCAQHELDHLDGLVTFDRLSPEARRVVEATYSVSFPARPA
ncbi:MAG: peptide deformylase [Rhodobacterales bacterium]